MSVAVIGTGVMGTGMAQSLATAGYEVACFDRQPEQLSRARELVLDGRYGLTRGVERGKLTQADAKATLDRLTFTNSLVDAVSGADLVIEAIPEDLTLKMNLFRELDAVTPTRTLLASNTSGLPIAAMAGATTRPDKVIGWHWASPAVVMRMAEIAVTEQTAQSAIDTVVEMALRCGKRPVIVRENVQAWGFVGNRVVNALLREARQVVAEGIVSEEGLDQILTDGWGWPVGPFRMIAGAGEGWGDERESSVKHTHRIY